MNGTERAGSSLEGGGRSSPEGLGLSARPCTGVLSVPGFLAIIGPFLPGKEVYSEVRKPTFLPAHPCLFDNRNKPVIPDER